MPSSPGLTPEQLTEIRQNTDWRQLFAALQIAKDEAKSKDWDWWGKSPFKPRESGASFHMNARGWHCRSTGQGGGPIELVQRLYDNMTCYQAGRWLLEHGVSRVVATTRVEVAEVSDQEESDRTGPDDESTPCNPPIRQDLRPQLDPAHATYEERGISPEVLRELGAGYLERHRKSKHPDPMNRRLVFQVRGLDQDASGELRPVILGHIGRATTEEQVEQDGEWWTYRGFRKSIELYNLDLVALETEAREQVKKTGRVLLVPGCFDVAKLRAVGIRNAVACFGSSLSPAQIERLRWLTQEVGAEEVRLLFDRDEAGFEGVVTALKTLRAAGLTANPFDWNQTWSARERGEIGIPEPIASCCGFSVEQLQWLRTKGLI